MAKLARTRITPDMPTPAGVPLSIAGAVAVYFEYLGWGWFWIGAALFVVGSILDILDGALARSRGAGSPFGARPPPRPPRPRARAEPRGRVAVRRVHRLDGRPRRRSVHARSDRARDD